MLKKQQTTKQPQAKKKLEGKFKLNDNHVSEQQLDRLSCFATAETTKKRLEQLRKKQTYEKQTD
jgi:hypothetical protein